VQEEQKEIIYLAYWKGPQENAEKVAERVTDVLDAASKEGLVRWRKEDPTVEPKEGLIREWMIKRLWIDPIHEESYSEGFRDGVNSILSKEHLKAI